MKFWRSRSARSHLASIGNLKFQPSNKLITSLTSHHLCRRLSLKRRVAAQSPAGRTALEAVQLDQAEPAPQNPAA